MPGNVVPLPGGGRAPKAGQTTIPSVPRDAERAPAGGACARVIAAAFGTRRLRAALQRGAWASAEAAFLHPHHPAAVPVPRDLGARALC